MNVTLRPATSKDWRAIASLLEESGLPLDGAQAQLSAFLVALVDRNVLACAALEVHEDVGLLRSVAVAPLLRGKGVGKLLVARHLVEAAQRGITGVYLLTTTAAEYFERLGFRREAIAGAPSALRNSAEFQGACPASATFMALVPTPP